MYRTEAMVHFFFVDHNHYILNNFIYLKSKRFHILGKKFNFCFTVFLFAMHLSSLLYCGTVKTK